MTRWLAWFLLAPQAYLVAGVWRDCGLPAFDVGVLWCLFLAFFAERRALPWLLPGVALALPRLAGLLGGWFAQPSASAQSDWLVVLWTAVFAPPLLAVARRLPPCRGFVEAA